jgi:hypothetical protein
MQSHSMQGHASHTFFPWHTPSLLLYVTALCVCHSQCVCTALRLHAWWWRPRCIICIMSPQGQLNRCCVGPGRNAGHYYCQGCRSQRCRSQCSCAACVAVRCSYCCTGQCWLVWRCRRCGTARAVAVSAAAASVVALHVLLVGAGHFGIVGCSLG